MRKKTFVLPTAIRTLEHRGRIMAKRELYGKARATQRPFGLIELFSTADRRRNGLPHQSGQERLRRLAQPAVIRALAEA